MPILIRILAYILIACFVRIVFLSAQKENQKEMTAASCKQHIVIRYPKMYLFVGLISLALGAVFFVLLFIRPTFVTGEKALWPLFVSFTIAGAGLVLFSLFWRIELFEEKDYFLYQCPPFKAQKIYYSDCISYQCRPHSLVLKTVRKTIYVEDLFVNAALLPHVLRKHNIKEAATRTSPHGGVRITPPAGTVLIGVLGLISGCILLFSPKERIEGGQMWTIPALFLLLSSIYLVLYGLFWQIEVLEKEDYFLFRNPFGQTYQIFYTDCIRYTFGKTRLTVETTTKTFRISRNSNHCEILARTLYRHKVSQK